MELPDARSFVRGRARASLSSTGVTLLASVAKATYRPSPKIEGVQESPLI